MTLKVSLNVNGKEYLPPAEWLSDFVASIGAYCERDVEPGMKANGFRIVGSAVASKAESATIEARTPNVEARLL